MYFFHFNELNTSSHELSLAGNTWVSSTDTRTGGHLEAQRVRRFKRVWPSQPTQLHSVQIRRYTGWCLPCLPGCTCSTGVRPGQTATV